MNSQPINLKLLTEFNNIIYVYNNKCKIPLFIRYINHIKKINKNTKKLKEIKKIFKTIKNIDDRIKYLLEISTLKKDLKFGYCIINIIKNYYINIKNNIDIYFQNLKCNCNISFYNYDEFDIYIKFITDLLKENVLKQYKKFKTISVDNENYVNISTKLKKQYIYVINIKKKFNNILKLINRYDLDNINKLSCIIYNMHNLLLINNSY